MEVADDIIVGPGAVLTIPEGCIIKMPADKKIIDDKLLINFITWKLLVKSYRQELLTKIISKNY